ncbi:MAG: hypothetical protein HOW73_30005 [Polyangiaceae bacterium]|nr:hypothetical protein [Polyangiaceae bacterium]
MAFFFGSGTARSLRTMGLVVVAGVTTVGCSSVCDEVAEEAEAGGCAVGVLPDEEDGNTEELTSCEGVREAKAQCLLDLTESVCAVTEDEAAALAACYEAAENSPSE